MKKQKLTKTSEFLLYLLATEQLAAHALEPMHKKMHRTLAGQSFEYRGFLYKLVKRGVIRFVDQNNKESYVLTEEGKLEALITKARLTKLPSKWDGKWRLVVFDIPEVTKEARNLLRRLLVQNGYKLLQASVFISPYPLNRSAIDYLISSKLIKFIRIMKIEEIDSDVDLKKRFNLCT